MSHFSERFYCDFQDEDILTSHEVREVVAANSPERHLPISPRWLSDTARALDLPKRKPGPRDVFYKYKDIKNLVVAATRGRRAHDQPSPNALRQRAFKERRKLDQVHELLDIHEIKKEPGD